MLEHDDVPGVADDDVLGAGKRARDRSAVLRRREDVVLAVEDERLAAVEGAQPAGLVVVVERGVNATSP